MSRVASVAPLFGLETPHPLQPTQNYFQLIGWAFLPQSQSVDNTSAEGGSTSVQPGSGRADTVTERSDRVRVVPPSESSISADPRGASEKQAVRIVVASQTFSPVERIERSDVASTFPHEPAALNSGFKFICYLPFGFYTGQLEVSSDSVTWHLVCPLAIPVSSHPILGAIEKSSESTEITEPIRIEGWCYHPEFRVREIVLQFGNVEVPCDYGLPRPDVALRFPSDPAAQACGFITAENLPRGSGPIKIRATTSCGRVYFIRSDHTVNIRSGWIPKPPPPSPVRDLSTLPDARALRDSSAANPGKAGGRNILFALYGDFSANSALHVASFANELISVGYDCVVAVPEHKETVGALAQANFMALQFDELPALSTYFKDGLGPCIVHAWTSRENVRKFTKQVAAIYHCAVFVHLEDNEQDILETRLGRPFTELAALSTAELDDLVPEVLSHPHRAWDFLRSATGVTVIVDRLQEHVPPQRPSAVIWPATDNRQFAPRSRDDRLRSALGIADRDVVLFYHGNVHTSNAAEVRSLYEAVALLNARGIRTQLVRAGRDYPDFLPEGDAWIRPYLIHLGHVRPQYLARLMALADFFVQPGLPDAFNDYRFPSKLPEFFSIGRPIILPKTNLGGFLRHGEDAWVLPCADGPGIADAIATLHVDHALTDKLSRGALAFAAEHFSWSRSAAKLVEFYRSLTPLSAPASS